MAQPSDVRTVNRALVLLGTAQRITSLDDGTPLAQAALDIFEDCRDEVLAEHPWNFAIRRATLAEAAGVELLDDWGSAYELPADCLRWLPWAEGHALYFRGVREGRYLLTEEDAAPGIRYIAQITDAAAWSPGFREALSGKLALWLATSAPVQSEMSARRIAGIYTDALTRGKRQDALEHSDNARGQVSRSSWLQARESSGSDS